MCVVSYVGDTFRDRFPGKHPWYVPTVSPPTPTFQEIISGISRAEFDALKKEIEELKRLLKNAKEIDELTGQPDCEMDSKVDFIKKIAEAVGVDLEDVFGKKKESK